MKSYIILALAVSALATPLPQAGVDCSGDGSIVCISNSEFGLCANGKAIPQPVAAGTECVNGAIQTAGSGGGDNGGNNGGDNTTNGNNDNNNDEQPPPPEENNDPPPPPPENNVDNNTNGNNDDGGDDAPPPEENNNDNNNGGDGLSVDLVPDFGVERGQSANDFGDCKGAVEGVLIPCDCPPSKEDFLSKLREFQANGNVTPIGETIVFPTGDSNADKLQRIEMSVKILQNFRGTPGAGCPAASTTLLKQAADLRG